MCTCINFKTKDNYFGRNLDLEYRFNEKVVITPRNYKFNLKNGTSITSKYSMIGMATVVSNYPLYAEATNKKDYLWQDYIFLKMLVFLKRKIIN